MLNLTIWTTSECNLRCKYCYEKENKYPKKNSIDKTILINYIKDRIIQTNFDEYIVIQFHGGEPLLNFEMIRDFVEIIESIKDKRIIKYGFTTNGTIWNEEIKSFLIKYKDSFNGYISISIDGNKESHNLNRKFISGKETFDYVIETSKELLSIFPRLRVRSTISHNTITNLYNNILFLILNGFKQIAISFDIFSSDWNEKSINIIEKEYDKILHLLNTNLLYDVELSIIDEIIKLKCKKCICNISENIYIDGYIYPCTFVVGIKEYIIGDIYNGINKEKINLLEKINLIDNTICKGCKNIEYCSSNRCKFLNKSITGDFYTPPIIECVLENIKAEKSKFISYNGEKPLYIKKIKGWCYYEKRI